MAQVTINNGDTGLAARTAINGNFTELYGTPSWAYIFTGQLFNRDNNGAYITLQASDCVVIDPRVTATALQLNGRLALSGTTSSFPALKRSGTTVQVRLADDSGFGDLEVQNLTVHGTGGGAPGLPVWTYTAGAMAAGKIKTNDTNPQATTTISLSTDPKDGPGPDLSAASLPSGGVMVLTSSAGVSSFFQITATANASESIDFTVTALAAPETVWSGDFQVSFYSLGASMVVDTGWTANAGAGDKTVVISNYSNAWNGTMTTDLDTLSPGAGTEISTALAALQEIRSKVQALETALVSKLLPNA